ncbi:MAG: hypothetical protein LBC52_01635 [Treponema sp.]|nr:hypothetical protein [Treponema sp.]
MKKTIYKTLIFIICVFVGVKLHAEISLPFFGNNNFDITTDTTFSADMSQGSTGLLTTIGLGLWFEFVPYQDRNITPQRDVLSVSLKLANSAVYAWRGYNMFYEEGGDNNNMGEDSNGNYVSKPNDVAVDQATSIWFDTFIAQLEYNMFWVRIAGIEPEVTLSQASIKSVFDPLINNRTAVDKNLMYLPLFSTGGHYNPFNVGVTSVIHRDLVHLNRREVEIAGNLSAGMKTEIFDLALKAGAWKTASENDKNAWIAGLDFSIRPDLSNTVNFSFLSAVNYGTVTILNKSDDSPLGDPSPDPTALEENPMAFGLGYEYRINLPNRMVIKPYAGVDFIYETKSGEYDWEIGGGIQWFFRGTGAQFKRNTKIGGIALGDVEIPAALIIGMNVDKRGIVNAIISFNEDPRTSPIPRFGGFFDIELMNIAGKEFTSLYYDGDVSAFVQKDYNDFLWASMVQLEYLLHDKIMPYVIFRYMPARVPADRRKQSPLFGKEYHSVTSKFGVRFTPLKYFALDVWYERTDVSVKDKWILDNGILSFLFGISLSY